MDLRDNKSRLILIVVALGAALVIGVASCGGGGDDGGSQGSEETSATASPDPEESEGTQTPGEDGQGGEEPAEVLAEVTGEESITLTFTRAEREAGGFLTVEGTIHNGGGDTWFASIWSGDEAELAGNGFSMAGASLIAHEEGKRYLILRDTSGRCLCTGFGSGIEPGDTVSWYAQFPEPNQATTEVDFQVGSMSPATIPIR